MSLTTKSRYPGLSVVLLKNVGRQKLSGTATNAGLNSLPVSTRFSGQQSVLDVTSYIGEQGSVNVRKSVRDPAGTFTIEFTDRLIPQEDDSIYGLFEPMDVVEIRMAGNAFQYKTQASPASSGYVDLPGFYDDAPTPTVAPSKSSSPLPIMMRGFISSVSRSESIGSDGKPTRKVTVSGQDYGKIWQIDQVYFNPYMPDASNYITTFKLFTRFGIAFQTESAGALVNDVINKILNPFISQMTAKGSASITSGTSPLLQLTPDMQTQGGAVAPYGVSDWQGGSMYELLQSFGDVGLWNELFIEDRESGPYVVFRPNPFIVAGGDVTKTSDYINGNTKLPSKLLLDRTYILSIEVTRSDANVANYYWVEAAQYDFDHGFLTKALAANGGPASTFIIQNYGNCDPAIYGLKRMTGQTMQSGFGISGGGGTPKNENQKDASSYISWVGNRRAALVNQNKDNVIFESGTMRLVGHELIKAGTYLLINHGNMTSTYYVVEASHSYQPFGTYTTTINFERGTGFIDRVQKGSGSDSPYWAELADAQS